MSFGIDISLEEDAGMYAQTSFPFAQKVKDLGKGLLDVQSDIGRLSRLMDAREDSLAQYGPDSDDYSAEIAEVSDLIDAKAEGHKEIWNDLADRGYIIPDKYQTDDVCDVYHESFRDVIDTYNDNVVYAMPADALLKYTELMLQDGQEVDIDRVNAKLLGEIKSLEERYMDELYASGVDASQFESIEYNENAAELKKSIEEFDMVFPNTLSSEVTEAISLHTPKPVIEVNGEVMVDDGRIGRVTLSDMVSDIESKSEPSNSLSL